MEDALGSGHGRLQDIEFVAEILDRLKEALRIQHEFDQHADGHEADQGLESSVPEGGDDGGDAEELDGGIEESEGQDGVLIRFHVDAVELGELVTRFALAIKELHDAHPADVLLQERVDAGDGGADAAVGVAHPVAEDPRRQKDEGHHRKRRQRQPPVHLHHDEDEHQQQEGVVDHRRDTRGEQIVEGVDVGGDAGDQAADRAVVVKTHGQALQALEDFLAQVVHGVLADPLHHAHLQVLEEKSARQRGQVQQRHRGDAAPARRARQIAMQRRHDVAVHGNFENFGAGRRERRDREGQQRGDGHPSGVGAQVPHQPAGETPVVGFP